MLESDVCYHLEVAPSVKATEVTAAWQKVTAAYCQVYGVIHFTSLAG